MTISPDMNRADEGLESVLEDERFFRQVNIEFLIHELKDPLSVVETSAAMLLQKREQYGALTQRQENALARLLRGARKARAMLYDLLEVGRAENACFNCRAFAPEDVLRDVLLEVIEVREPEIHDEISKLTDLNRKFAALSNRQIRLEIASAAARIELMHDEVKFRQIVGNLLKNAFQYRRQLLLVHLACRQERVSISVRDDGPGIAPNHHQAIFERYKQVSPLPGIARSGHGLGLAVARILARSMGGDIELESELGQGATFRLHLPLTFGDGKG